MKKLTLLFAVLVTLASFLILNINKEQTLVSPLLKKGKVLGLNQWFPQVLADNPDQDLQISAKAALFIETKAGQALYSKNAKERLPIASLVKVMTALIVLEHRKMDDQFVVSQRAADMEPDKMQLISKEKLTLKELLYGVFLISANDAAEVIAEGTTGDREEFIRLMNSKAMQLGMKDTFFVNPTGLDEDSQNSYSTAYDLAILTRFLIRHFPQVIDISQSEHIYLPITENHQDYDMYSGINLLTSYPGVKGFKTGFTPEAGLTLITLARINGYEVVGVLLGSDNRRDEARELLDYSFAKLGVKI